MFQTLLVVCSRYKAGFCTVSGFQDIFMNDLHIVCQLMHDIFLIDNKLLWRCSLCINDGNVLIDGYKDSFVTLAAVSCYE